MEFNGSFDISTGRNRKETHWKKTRLTWGELINKLRKTHRTSEGQAEYMTYSKERQADIKDVGGFVGGELAGGRRLKNNILNRQLITLDVDYADPDFWEKLQQWFVETAVLYSTHKHTPEKPRLRLIMPLLEPVKPDEYEAIARWIAGVLNIELFDDTTFEPHRLMYWPSTSKDGEYLFRYQDGKAIDGRAILKNEYQNWKDESQWPVSNRVDKIINREIKKQSDPLEKPGILGAFCRARTVQETIKEFLSEVYTPLTEDRYTYSEGSAAGGLKIYDDKFAYSHHSTDPISGLLCNAFDLVRIHKFGSRDEGLSKETPLNKLPSFIAMIDFAAKDKLVKKQIEEDRWLEIEEDFEKYALEPLDTQDSLFILKPAASWIEHAKKRPIPKELFGKLWFEGELCILYADTNLGKSILAVQIADSISKGEGIAGFNLQAKKQPVLYLDFELSDKQFETRYSNGYKDHYGFDKNLIRVEINPNVSIPKRMSFEQFLYDSIDKAITETGAKVIIIDNITYLKSETEKARDALPLMKYLKALKNKHNLSMLVLAHTPKRDLSKPITRNDLQGSKMLINFCDSSFAIGESSKDKNIRYLKQIKSRNTEIIFDSENVCIFQIDKPNNFLQFEFLEFGKESEHLKQATEKDKEKLNRQVYELNEQGRSLREIGQELGISHMQVSRIVKKMEENSML